MQSLQAYKNIIMLLCLGFGRKKESLAYCLPMLGCCSFRHILASRSNFWKSVKWTKNGNFSFPSSWTVME